MIKKIITTTVKEIALFVRVERAFLAVTLGILAMVAGFVYLTRDPGDQGGGTMLQKRRMKRAAAERAASQQ